mmetsp:Transcript_24859/g.68532  ORF Transcript_24859/g.68532 Transcript_24859/m.68532 type:complete len:244 (-) Transcript_24859:89-820(-)
MRHVFEGSQVESFFRLVPLAGHVSVVLQDFSQKVRRHDLLLRSRKGTHLFGLVVFLGLQFVPAPGLFFAIVHRARITGTGTHSRWGRWGRSHSGGCSKHSRRRWKVLAVIGRDHSRRRRHSRRRHSGRTHSGRSHSGRRHSGRSHSGRRHSGRHPAWRRSHSWRRPHARRPHAGRRPHSGRRTHARRRSHARRRTHSGRWRRDRCLVVRFRIHSALGKASRETRVVLQIGLAHLLFLCCSRNI